jgi:hypothetical protein
VKAYYKLVQCDCGNEWYIIAEERRGIVPCDECGQLHDIWINSFLMEGTMEEIIGYLEAE